MNSVVKWIEKDPVWAFGLSLGLLPVLSGLIFRTYTYHTSPAWFEQSRQFDTLFVFFEISIVLIARRRGMDYFELFCRLDRASSVALIVFLATFWVSSALISHYPTISMVRILQWVVHIGFGCALYYLFEKVTLRELETVAKGLFAGFLLYLPIVWVHFAFAPEPETVGGSEIIWTSAVPGYLSVRLFGFYAAALAALAVGALWSRSRLAREDAWLYAMLAMNLMMLFWSGTRAGVFGVALAIIALPLITRRCPSTQCLIALAALFPFSLAASELVYQPHSSFGVLRTAYGSETLDYTTGRADIWRFAMARISESPIWGHGEAAMLWLFEGEGGHQQPHNALLQMLMSWGAMATLAAVYLLGSLVLPLVRRAASSSALTPLLALLISLTVMSAVDGVLYNPRTAMLVVIALALVLVVLREDRLAAHEARDTSPHR